MLKTLHSPIARALAAAALAALVAGSFPAHAESFGGVEFPGGVSSFADAVTSYAPGGNASNPSAPHRVPGNAIGAPDYAGVNSCGGTCSFVSLGSGGTLIVEFTNNRLTGSGTAALDLWIFEVGPDVEDTFVALSKDGVTWFEVGKVFGATAGINIDAFGFGIADEFRFVRLIDDAAEGGASGLTAGADIDSVGAISSIVAQPIPEPETYALMLVGLGVLGAVGRRRKATSAG